jgi:DNA primase
MLWNMRTARVAADALLHTFLWPWGHPIAGAVAVAVATLGTATTPTHVQKLLRQADEIVFCFDGDAAGRRAAWHALEVSLEALADHKAVRFLFLPAEHDPDSYVREFGHAAFEAKLDESEPCRRTCCAS